MGIEGRDLKRTLAIHDRISRVYADDRFPVPRGGACDLRTFTVTLIWVVGAERAPKGERWKRVCQLLHLNDYRFWETIRQDVPRYEPIGWDQGGGECEAPMVRRDGLCGHSTYMSFRVTAPDGTWRMAGFCSRHQEQSAQAQRAERARVAAGIPDPPPNQGGLLPCYMGYNWPSLYAKADPHWKPPGIGIRADDWPVLAKVSALEPPSLSVLEGGGDAFGLPQDGHAAPSLRLL